MESKDSVRHWKRSTRAYGHCNGTMKSCLEYLSHSFILSQASTSTLSLLEAFPSLSPYPKAPLLLGAQGRIVSGNSEEIDCHYIALKIIAIS